MFRDNWKKSIKPLQKMFINSGFFKKKIRVKTIQFPPKQWGYIMQLHFIGYLKNMQVIMYYLKISRR